MAGSSWTNQVQNLVIVGGSGGVSGVFVYNGVPGPGTLIGSITDSSKDPFGNVTLTGVAGYTTSGGAFYATQIGNSGSASAMIFYKAATEAGPWAALGNIAADSNSVRIVSFGGLTLNQASGTTSAAVITPSGFGGVPWLAAAIDSSTNSAGNDANPHDVTVAWPVPAGDPAGTRYLVKGHLLVNTGQTTIETLTLGVDINSGTRTALATLGTAFNAGALNTSYDVPFELSLIVDNQGVNTPQIVLNATLADLSANRQSTNSANMHGHSNTATWNKGSANTLAVYAQWGGAGGSAQIAQTTWSEFTRIGQ